MEYITLNDGNRIPAIGFGVFLAVLLLGLKKNPSRKTAKNCAWTTRGASNP